MNRLMDKKAKTVFLITLCFRNADCSCVCKVWHFVFKTEMSRTQDEIGGDGGVWYS